MNKKTDTPQDLLRRRAQAHCAADPDNEVERGFELIRMVLDHRGHENALRLDTTQDERSTRITLIVADQNDAEHGEVEDAFDAIRKILDHKGHHHIQDTAIGQDAAHTQIAFSATHAPEAEEAGEGCA